MQTPRLISFLAAAALAAFACAADAAPQACFSVTPETCATARHLGRGINMGNMLDAPREGDWGVKLEPAYIDKVAGAFTTVRVPVRWSNHAAPTADATIDPAFARRVDQVVDAFLAKGMYVILDVHHYTQISGDKQHPHEFTVDPSVVDVRLVNLWKQIAQRYKDRSPKLMFELLNEPHDRLSGERWNSLALRALDAVRASNPNRTVFIGPDEWNSVGELKKLRLPMDRNIIVMVHNYDPMSFTHQGIEWMPQYKVGPKCCDDAQRKQIADALEAARRWNELTGYPVYLGEFGSYEKADMASRAAYTRIVRDEAEKRGIGWAYWEFASSFGVFDPKTGHWIEPLRHALLD